MDKIGILDVQRIAANVPIEKNLISEKEVPEN
jgi:hypothetical protein